jgi:hypothetical protein
LQPQPARRHKVTETTSNGFDSRRHHHFRPLFTGRFRYVPAAANFSTRLGLAFSIEQRDRGFQGGLVLVKR